MAMDDKRKDESLKADREIGDYRIIRLLGKGGMSEVYEAEHKRLGSRHAIKFFTYAKNVDGVRERFLAEGKLLAKLSHPRIVRVTDIGTDAETGQPYFVMDRIADPEGNVRSLADVPAGSADETQVGMWYDDLREGLAYIHAKGVIHRDLKLENVLIGADGHAVLTDFGISKIGAAANGDTVVDPVQTVIRLRDGKNPLMGSLGYMAPELEMGVAASPQSDYYALGVIVFRLLTGTWCDARTDVVGNLETYDPVWRQIVPKLLHANPRGRECPAWGELKVADAERRLCDLENALDKSRGKTRKEKRRARVAFGLVLSCAVAAVICGGWLMRGKSRIVAPSFEEIVFVPADAPEEATTEDQIAREQFVSAIPDAWVLSHEVLFDLRKGTVAAEKAVSELENLARRAEEEDLDLFDRYEGYNSSGEPAALAKLLQAAAKRVKERYGLK